MRVLFVTSMPINYNASANVRNIAIIDGLIKNGVSVDILCSYADSNNKFVDKSIKMDKFNIIYIGKKIDYSSSNKKSLKSFLINIIKKIYSSVNIYDNRKALLRYVNSMTFSESYDAIISSSDPKSSHLIAERIIKKNPLLAKKWIQYWGDPFAGDINNSSVLSKIFIRKEEKRLIRIADKVVYVSPFTLSYQKNQYSKYSDKMFFLPIPYTKERIYKKVFNNVKTVGYFGDYYSSIRNIMPLYDSCNSGKYKLIICGNTDLKLQEDNNITILKRQDREKIKDLEAKCDILVCICNVCGTQIPGKTYHYAATNKPVLIILDGDNPDEMKDFFSSFNRYYMCYNNTDSIDKTISMILEKSDEFTPVKDLNSKIVAKELLNIVSKNEVKK